MSKDSPRLELGDGFEVSDGLQARTSAVQICVHLVIAAILVTGKVWFCDMHIE